MSNQLPGLPASTTVSDDDLLLKRDTAATEDQKATAAELREYFQRETVDEDAGSTGVTLTTDDPNINVFNPTTSITVKLDDSFLGGRNITIVNQGTGAITVTAADDSTIGEVPDDSSSVFKCVFDNPADNTGWALVSGAGGGAGSGLLNLIANPSTASGWTKTGTVFSDPVTTTDPGDLPLGGIVKTAIQFNATGSGTEAADYNSFEFTVPKSINSVLGVNLYLRPGTGFVASEWTISVYQGSTRQNMYYDVSGVSYLPAQDTFYNNSFYGEPETTYTLRVARTSGTGSAVLNVALVEVTNGTVAPVPPQGYLGQLSTTGSWTSNATYVGKYWRNNNRLLGVVAVSVTGTPTSAALTISIPSGLTIDTTAMPVAGGGTTPVGYGTVRDAATATYPATVMYNNTTSVGVFYMDDAAGGVLQSAVTQAVPITFTTSDTIQIVFDVPILEWADSPQYVANAKQAVVQVRADRNGTDQTGLNPNNSIVQLLFNSVSSATAFSVGGGYSTSGSYFEAPASGKYLIAAAARIGNNNVLSNRYVLRATVGTTNFASSSTLSNLADVNATASTGFSLIGSTVVSLTAGQRVFIGLVGIGNNSASTLTMDGGTETSWFTVSRLTDEYGRPVVGFGTVTQDNAGLVKKAGQLLGTNTNDDAAAGYVGEYKQANSAGAGVGSSSTAPNTNIASISLGPGDWDVWGSAVLTLGSITSPNTLTLGVSKSSGSMDAFNVGGFFRISNIGTTTSPFFGTNPRRISLGTTTTIYLVAGISHGGAGTAAWATESGIYARRVR